MIDKNIKSTSWDSLLKPIPEAKCVSKRPISFLEEQNTFNKRIRLEINPKSGLKNSAGDAISHVKPKSISDNENSMSELSSLFYEPIASTSGSSINRNSSESFQPQSSDQQSTPLRLSSNNDTSIPNSSSTPSLLNDHTELIAQMSTPNAVCATQDSVSISSQCTSYPWVTSSKGFTPIADVSQVLFQGVGPEESTEDILLDMASFNGSSGSLESKGSPVKILASSNSDPSIQAGIPGFPKNRSFKNPGKENIFE